MNGATADPWLKTINPPKIASTIKIGNNQNFFLAAKKSSSSLINDKSFCP